MDALYPPSFMDLLTINENILRLSAELDMLGDDLKDMADDLYRMKCEIFGHEMVEQDRIRENEDNGRLKLKNGREIKLTDPIRLSIAHFGKKDLVAQYEGLKRKRDALKLALEAKRGALSGYQSAGNSLRDEMKLGQYTT